MSKKWNAIYKPATINEDFTRYGFNTEEEAANYIYQFICEECKDDMFDDFVLLETACGQEWLIEEDYS